MAREIKVKFVGIDDWNRPVFKSERNNYFGSVEILFEYGASEETVLETIKAEHLEYFGSSFNCEPIGGVIEGIVIERN